LKFLSVHEEEVVSSKDSGLINKTADFAPLRCTWDVVHSRVKDLPNAGVLMGFKERFQQQVDKMPSSAFFWDACPVRWRSAGKGSVPYITYSCPFDSPHMCTRHALHAGVDIVVTTLWLGHESMQTAHGRTWGRLILQGPSPAESPSRRPIFQWYAKPTSLCWRSSARS